MEHIFDTIRKYHMVEPGMRVVAGVSGGADSVCLLYVLSRYRSLVHFELLAVHVEHGIRGQESLEDAEFTEKLCAGLGVPCRIVRSAVPQIAKEQGMSVEEAGRAERYRIFEEICDTWHGDRIAVAHNQNDQAETVLWNLARGSGIKGLGGIRPVRGNVIRPLLFTDRKEIEHILNGAGLSWRTDRTNLEQAYTRNKIRLSILPQLERELNARAGEHIADAAEKLRQIQDFVERMTDRAAQSCLAVEETAAEGCLSVEKVAAESDSPPQEISAEKCSPSVRISVIIHLEKYGGQDELIRTELLKRAVRMCRGGAGLKDIGSVHIEMLAQLAGMDCGKECHLPGGLRAVRENGIVRLTQMDKESGAENAEVSAAKLHAKLCTEYALPVPGSLEIPGWHVETALLENNEAVTEKIQKENQYTKWLSYDIINSNVLLRMRRTGDYLVVGAQGGRKKLKDYLIDQKIPREKRDQIWVLADGSHILWVVGCRISEAAKVRQETKRVIKIQMEERR